MLNAAARTYQTEASLTDASPFKDTLPAPRATSPDPNSRRG